MSSETDDDDVYVAQLREVFNDCDEQGDGWLDREGLLLLCQRLQIQDQATNLIGRCLAETSEDKVSFLHI